MRDSKDHVYVIDFSPFGEKWSEALAFEWEDLHVDDEEGEDVRIIYYYYLI